MLTYYAYTLGAADDPVDVPGGAGYYLRRRRWMMAAVIAFLLVGGF